MPPVFTKYRIKLIDFYHSGSRQLADPFGGSGGDCLNRQRRVNGGRSRKNRTVADKQVRYVVRVAIAVDDRVFRLRSHPASSHNMRRSFRRPNVRAACRFENLLHFRPRVFDDFFYRFRGG